MSARVMTPPLDVVAIGDEPECIGGSMNERGEFLVGVCWLSRMASWAERGISRCEAHEASVRRMAEVVRHILRRNWCWWCGWIWLWNMLG